MPVTKPTKKPLVKKPLVKKHLAKTTGAVLAVDRQRHRCKVELTNGRLLAQVYDETPAGARQLAKSFVAWYNLGTKAVSTP